MEDWHIRSYCLLSPITPRGCGKRTRSGQAPSASTAVRSYKSIRPTSAPTCSFGDRAGGLSGDRGAGSQAVVSRPLVAVHPRVAVDLQLLDHLEPGRGRRCAPVAADPPQRSPSRRSHRARTPHHEPFNDSVYAAGAGADACFRPDGAVPLAATGRLLGRPSGSRLSACKVSDRPDASKRHDGRSGSPDERVRCSPS